MARITRATLDSYARRAAIDLGLPVEEIWIQNSETGYSVFRQFGAGAQALVECLNAKEAYYFLRGLSCGSQLRTQLAAKEALASA